MRIIAGSARGREIFPPRTRQVRPMTDMNRESVFAILGSVDSLLILDTYAGTGALGLEALSRGAARVDGIERSRQICNLIHKNTQHLGFEDKYRLFCMSMERWLTRFGRSKDRYNIIFADPPFTKLKIEVFDRLSTHLSRGGTMVLKYDSHIQPPPIDGLKFIRTQKYGDSAVAFYQL